MLRLGVIVTFEATTWPFEYEVMICFMIVGPVNTMTPQIKDRVQIV